MMWWWWWWWIIPCTLIITNEHFDARKYLTLEGKDELSISGWMNDATQRHLEHLEDHDFFTIWYINQIKLSDWHAFSQPDWQSIIFQKYRFSMEKKISNKEIEARFKIYFGNEFFFNFTWQFTIGEKNWTPIIENSQKKKIEEKNVNLN